MRVLFFTAAALAASIASLAQAVNLDSERYAIPYYGAEYSQLESYEEKKADDKKPAEKKPVAVGSKQENQRKNDEDVVMKTMAAMKMPAAS